MVMPIGILIIKYENKSELELIGKYPQDLNINKESLTNKLYNSHLKELSSPEIIHINLNKCHALIYFSGSGENSFLIEDYLIILLLKENEKPKKYREILFKITADILNNIPIDFNIFNFFKDNKKLRI